MTHKQICKKCPYYKTGGKRWFCDKTNHLQNQLGYYMVYDHISFKPPDYCKFILEHVMIK